MDDRLNGTGWGELPEKEWDLQIPEFMKSSGYAVPKVPVSAYCGQAVGRVKRRQHMEQRERRKLVNGAFWMMVGFGLLVLAVNLPEWIL